MTNPPADHEVVASVLLACLRPEAPAGQAASLAAQLAPADWEALLQLARRHGVTPLLYHRLQRLAPAIPISSDLLRVLHTDYLATAARNTQLYHDLGTALRLFRRETIPVIVLKGAHLAQAVYGNIALRPMGDVDVLIRRADLPQVEALLLSNGYRSDPQNGPGMEAGHFHFIYHHQAPAGLMLEVHWHILPPSQADFVDLDGMWQRAEPANLAGVETQVFSPTDLLVHICLHLYHHRFEANLRALCDIAEVVCRRPGDLDWQQLSDGLRLEIARKVVYLALCLARDLLETPLPGDALCALYAGDAAEWVALLREAILRPEAAVLSLKTSPLTQIWGNQPPLQKAARLLSGLFPSAETMSLLYPVEPNAVGRIRYYPRYLRRVFRQYRRTAWRLLAGDAVLRQEAARLDALDRWLHSVE
jgi:hypothetical protein